LQKYYFSQYSHCKHYISKNLRYVAPNPLFLIFLENFKLSDKRKIPGQRKTQRGKGKKQLTTAKVR